MVNKILARTRDWFLPGLCTLCAAPASRLAALCRDCTVALPRQWPACPSCAALLPDPSAGQIPCGRCQHQPPAFDATLALYTYAAPLDRLVQRIKYSGDLALARELGEQLAIRVMESNPAHPDLLVPVPLHVSRLRTRGYNQAVELARPLSRRLCVSMDHRLVTRTRATAPQQDLNRRERARNLRNAFAVHGDLGGRQVAIVDDVMTSGATVASLAKALKRAGAGRVSVWVLARA